MHVFKHIVLIKGRTIRAVERCLEATGDCGKQAIKLLDVCTLLNVRQCLA